ncbi:MAG: hypothetical protein WD208_09170 [Dehalococcoidia bacterium]
MNLGPHLAVSTVIGAGVWAATGEVNALPAAVAAGVLPDADHLLEYYLKYVRRERRFLFLMFHGWEFLAAGVAIYLFVIPEPWMLAAVLGYASQVGSDQVFNRVRWHTYFFTARAILGFRSEKVLGRDDSESYMALVNSVPFGRARLRRWLEDRL